MSRQDYTGVRFGRLVVRSEVNSRSNHRKLSCVCDCGGSKEVFYTSLQQGSTKSCGCLHKEKMKSNAKHGKKGTPVYQSWQHMKSRCLNPNDKNFKWYGKRGVTVCDRWLEFCKFYDDMGDPPEGFTIDRTDVNGDYNKDNCTWASRKEQSLNTRRSRKVTWKGQTLTVKEWSDLLSINYGTLLGRLRRGWLPDRALSTPVI